MRCLLTTLPRVPLSAEALALVQQQPPGSPGTAAAAAHTAAALAELAAAFQLLATLCGRDPQTAMELLHVEVPTGALEGGQRGPDLLTLACQAAAMLAQLADPPTAVIGAPQGSQRGWRPAARCAWTTRPLCFACPSFCAGPQPDDRLTWNLPALLTPAPDLQLTA